MTFLRLSRWDWLAFVTALALLFVMSLNWYSDKQGEECARVESLQTPTPGVQGAEITRDVRHDAEACKAKHRRTAWQAGAFIDRAIMVVLLAAAFAAVAAAFFRAADRRVSGLTPSALATGLGLLGALLVLYRILQPPGFNPAAVVKAGAPIGLACVGVLAIAARAAMLEEKAAGEEPPAETAAGEEAAAEPPQPSPDPEPEAPPTEPEAPST